MLETLLKRQADLGMTEAQFAKKLGVSRSTWNLAVSKRRPIGMTIISAILNNMPDLTIEAMAYLRDLDSASAESAIAAPDAIAIEDSARTPATTARAS